jgi:hypothetical protein
VKNVRTRVSHLILTDFERSVGSCGSDIDDGLVKNYFKQIKKHILFHG